MGNAQEHVWPVIRSASLKVTLILITVALLSGPFTLKVIYDAKHGSAVARICDNISTNSTAALELRNVAVLVKHNFQDYRVKTEGWSFIYFGCVFGSAVFSALAGLVLKFEFFPPTDEKRRRDTAAVCAAVGAMLVTLSTAGDFSRKWQANRAAATAMENLAYELPLATVNLAKVYERLQQINTARNEGILGVSSLTSTNAP